MRRFVTLVTAVVAMAFLSGSAATSSVTPAATPWHTKGITWTNPAAKAPRILNLRYAQHPTYDRVVIDVRGRLPGGHTAYRKVFHYDGSGAVVPIRGGLQVTLRPAYTYNTSGHDVYTGPDLVRPKFPVLKAIALTGSFEGVTGFAFGLQPRRTPYRVFFLHDPQRIVVDFRHAS